MTQVTSSVNRAERRHTWRAAGAAAAGAALTVVLSACGGGEEPTGEDTVKTSSAAVTPPASADPAAGEKTQVLQTYDGYWAAVVKSYAKADTTGTGLKTFTELDALSRVELDVARMKDAGTGQRGKPGHEVTVDTLALEKDIPTAKLTDCLDISGWKPVRDGKVVPFPDGQPTRYLTTATAEKWENRWLITKVTPHGDRAC